MSAVSLPRGQITTYVVEAMRAALQFPVGDNDNPSEPHGWQGEPNDTNATFIPWISIGTGASSNSSGPQSATAADWRANYFVTTAGVAREQTDSLADQTRSAMVKMVRQKILTTDGTWSLQQARVTSIGGINRMGQVRPHYFVQTDVIELWLSRELK